MISVPVRPAPVRPSQTALAPVLKHAPLPLLKRLL